MSKCLGSPFSPFSLVVVTELSLNFFALLSLDSLPSNITHAPCGAFLSHSCCGPKLRVRVAGRSSPNQLFLIRDRVLNPLVTAFPAIIVQWTGTGTGTWVMARSTWLPTWLTWSAPTSAIPTLFCGRTHAASCCCYLLLAKLFLVVSPLPCCGMPHSHTGKQTKPQTNKIDRRPTPTTGTGRTTHRMSFHTQLPQMPQICVIDLKMRQANQSAQRQSASCPPSVPESIFDLKCSAWTHSHSSRMASRVRHVPFGFTLERSF